MVGWGFVFCVCFVVFYLVFRASLFVDFRDVCVLLRGFSLRSIGSGIVIGFLCRLDGPLVKRLRRGPLKAETGVRFSYGSVFCFESFC